MDSKRVVSELAALKEAAIAASARNDQAFYASYLADDAVAILPQGQVGKAEVLASMTGERAPFSADRIEDTSIVALGPNAGVVTYRAIYKTPQGERRVAATTVYERRDGRWQGVLYQQTPLAAH